jgi:hypothetical protein
MARSSTMHRRLYIHPAHRTVGVPGGSFEMKPYCWRETWSSSSMSAEPMRVALVFHRQDHDARKRLAFTEQVLLGQCDARFDRVAFEALEARPLPNTLIEADAVVWLGQGLQIARHWVDFEENDRVKEDLPQCSSSEIEIRASFPGHPVLEGVRSFSTKCGFCLSLDIPEEATCLMTAQLNGECMPAAWTRYGRRGRVFSTLLGSAEDFRRPDFVRLMLNAIEWVRR